MLCRGANKIALPERGNALIGLISDADVVLLLLGKQNVNIFFFFFETSLKTSLSPETIIVSDINKKIITITSKNNASITN